MHVMDLLRKQLLRKINSVKETEMIIIPLKFTLNKKDKYVNIYLERTLEVFFHG